MMLFLLALIGAAVLYFRCGDGLGFGPGGGGLGDGKESADEPRAGDDKEAPDVRPAVGEAGEPVPRRCRLRLDAQGLTLDDRPTTLEKAVEACKRSGSAELTTTGDATFGEHERVQKALDRAGVEVFERKRE
jgi:hypothetical protein